MLFLKFLFAMVSFIHWIGLYFYVWHLSNWHRFDADDNDFSKDVTNTVITVFLSWIISSVFVFAIIGIWML